MRIDILTLFPGMFAGPLSESIVKRALSGGALEVELHDIRQWSEDRGGRVDDYQYGGGAGMVMQCAPLSAAIESLLSERSYDEVVYLTPDGERLTQGRCNSLSLAGNLLLLCGHYKGIDQRIRDEYVTLELSIGDYVLSGGELAAMVVVDSVARLQPGVLGDEESALTDSFQDGLLSPPLYTRPAVWRGRRVPDVLLSGNDKLIDQWREQQALEKTARWERQGGGNREQGTGQAELPGL